jgi:hypothetical protein
MKINIFIAVFSFLFLACNSEKQNKDENKNSASSTEEVIKFKSYVGEFIKVDDAAILKGNDYIYGVVLDSMGLALAEQAEALKYDEYDMIPVVVSGDVIPNENEDGWEELIQVKQIIRLSEPKMEESVEIKKSIN